MINRPSLAPSSTNHHAIGGDMAGVITAYFPHFPRFYNLYCFWLMLKLLFAWSKPYRGYIRYKTGIFWGNCQIIAPCFLYLYLYLYWVHFLVTIYKSIAYDIC
ncbi:hypothetical protein C0208_08550 [Moraxella catarrhalis]|nr:hypothetical protein [Moraxella catarrhalis]OBX43871.1 hypothetical protein A9Z57_04945 [Moraxella catarrhalis]